MKRLAIALLVIMGAAAAQEEKKDPTAEEILQKAAEKQGGLKIAKKFNNFKADFETQFYREDKGQVYYQVKRIYQFPDLLWTEKKHETQKKPTREIFNGEDAWFVEPEGEIVVYTDNPSSFKTDLENIEEDVRVTRELFRNFFIANLRSEINDLKRVKDAPIYAGGKPLFVVEGKLPSRVESEQVKTVYVKIYVDPETFEVRGVRMIDLSGGARRLFVFEDYMENRQKVMVPIRIKMHNEPVKEKKPDMTIFLNCKEGEEGEVYPLIDFNVDIDPDLFNLPDEA